MFHRLLLRIVSAPDRWIERRRVFVVNGPPERLGFLNWITAVGGPGPNNMFIMKLPLWTKTWDLRTRRRRWARIYIVKDRRWEIGPFFQGEV